MGNVTLDCVGVVLIAGGGRRIVAKSGPAFLYVNSDDWLLDVRVLRSASPSRDAVAHCRTVSVSGKASLCWAGRRRLAQAINTCTAHVYPVRGQDGLPAPDLTGTSPHEAA